jgi:hypothetical protein
MARFDHAIEPITLGNMRELGCGRSTSRAETATTRRCSAPIAGRMT